MGVSAADSLRSFMPLRSFAAGRNDYRGAQRSGQGGPKSRAEALRAGRIPGRKKRGQKRSDLEDPFLVQIRVCPVRLLEENAREGDDLRVRRDRPQYRSGRLTIESVH